MTSLENFNTTADHNNIGENSDDECCLCGKLWEPYCTGWPLCDTPNCPNVCCTDCSRALIVSDQFYCPMCSGSGQSAAATVGGAVASVVQVCNEIDSLPLSQKAIKSILRNLIKHPEDEKYRRLRLNNPRVKSLLDLDPCRRLLSQIGFVETTDELPNNNNDNNKEPVLLLEGSVDAKEVQQLLDIFEGVLEEEKEDGEDEDGHQKKNVEQQQQQQPKAGRIIGPKTNDDETKATAKESNNDEMDDAKSKLEYAESMTGSKRQLADGGDGDGDSDDDDQSPNKPPDVGDVDENNVTDVKRQKTE